MGRIAFMIIAHNTPNQMRRLIARLRHPGHHFFGHVDAKSDIAPFQSAAAAPDVTFLEPRRKVYWGDFTASQVTLDLAAAAMQAEDRFDYFVVLSGADHPLATAEAIDRFFERRAGTEFMSVVPIPAPVWGKPISRVEDYHLSPGRHWTMRAGYRLLEKAGLTPIKRDYRKALGGLQPYGGAHWWAMTRSATRYLLDFAAAHPRFVRFFHNCLIPDEAFFQTIMANSPFADRIRRSLTYTDWSAGGAHPTLFGMQHLPLLEKAMVAPAPSVFGEGAYLFARKFADDADEITATLDRLASTAAVTA